ncbi:hypothetical protein ACFO4E_07230 [Nocardiopsis mangrovi]|uniref:Uncharacterized protein n=1 Tax=Nocardiopsis mangrovi TaxID=1179818 RepID=A0ABV9DRW1_9ACTN
MLRRIHDPERGAGFTEYAAVILLVAAITAGVIGVGIPARVADLIGGGVDEADSAPGDDSPGGDSGQAGDGGGAAAQGTELPDPADGAAEGWGRSDGGAVVQADDTGSGEGGDGSGIRTVGWNPIEWGADLVSDGAGWLGELGGGFVNGGRNFVGGLIDFSPPVMAWDTITDPGGAVDGWWDGVVGTWNDPLGVFVSPETRESLGEGNYGEAIGYGIWDLGGLFSRTRIPKPPNGGGSDRGGGDNDRDRDGEREGDDHGGDDRDGDGNSCLAASGFVPAAPILLGDGSTAGTGAAGAGTVIGRVRALTVEEVRTYYLRARAASPLAHGGSWCTDEERVEDAEDIARGHANGKHSKEFPGLSTDDLVDLATDVMQNPSRTKELGSGRKAFLGKDGTTIVIHDPMNPDGGTIFRRDPADLEDYWRGLD